MLRRTLITAAAVLLSTAIAGCGFQLRGQLDVPEHLRQLTLVQTQNNPRLLGSMIETLRQNQLQISAEAPWRLVLQRVTEDRRTVTLDRRARVDEYELGLTVEFLVTDASGKPVLNSQRLRTERVYTYDANAETAADEQEQLLRQEMSDDLARQIVTRYLRIPATP
ncbi:MAG: LPS assembly lipoprotein LptE [Marinobacterium sp.]|nr:LPS assembly lipoprotein LptE [Marinobacterium sp.]